MSEVATKKERGERYIINIPFANDNEPKKVFVGANGLDVLIERGVDVEVSKEVLHALDLAVQGVPEVDPNDPNRVVISERKRFSYTIKGVVK